MKESIFKNLISPIVIGIIVLIGQFFIQPKISMRQIREIELWLKKQETYLKALNVLDKRFDSMEYKGSDPIRKPPETEEMSEVYRELLLITTNEDIPRNFMKFMDVSLNDYCSPVNRGKFINLLRSDLGKSFIKIPVDSIPYFRFFN